MRLVSDSSARGSVLLLTLVVTGLIAMVSLSFGATVEARVEVAREEAASLRTELAAQSALEWARRQLALDPEWKGTDGSLLLDEDLRLYFKVERLDGASSSWEPTEVSLDLEGSGTRSLTRLTANLSVDPGDPLRSAALSVLGGDFRARNLSVDGDLLVLDQPGLLWDPVRATGRPHRGDRHFQGRRLADGTMGKGRPWAQAPPMPWPVIEIFRLDISGCALRSSDTSFSRPQERRITRPIHSPAWNLDAWREVRPDAKVFDGVRALRNTTLKKTAVFILEPGEDLILENVRLLGGAVIWGASDHDPHGPARNRVILRGNNFLGGTSQGPALLAPCAEVRTAGGRHQLKGSSFWHSAGQLRRLESRGVCVVLGGIADARDCVFNWDPASASSAPEGMSFFGELPQVDVTGVGETPVLSSNGPGTARNSDARGRELGDDRHDRD